LPSLLFSEYAIAGFHERWHFPGLIRSGRYDSIVIGTSDARLLRPAALGKVFGSRFANVALSDGQAYEQYRLADLFIREVQHPRTLLIGLDHVWCYRNALEKRTTFRGFPEWMYDDNPWNDLAYMLNSTTVRISRRRLEVALGLNPPIFPDGYEVFTPPESAYDPVKVRSNLWGKNGPHKIEAMVPAYTASAEERASWKFPALAWLDEILSRFPGRTVLAVMPPHITLQPGPGSKKAAREDECKARIAEIAARYGAPLIDFRIHSEITANDDNYWDPLHYRLPIAERIVSGIERALASGKDDPNGDWDYLVGPEKAEISSVH